MQEPSLLPQSLDELVPEDHLVRVVNRVNEQLNLEPLLSKYKWGREEQLSSEDDAKVLVYAKVEKTIDIFSTNTDVVDDTRSPDPRQA